jgi:cellobiose phosphorylase
VEAYPEGDQAHLAAEGALYCRIIIEGMFGVRPVGFHEFECTPYLPEKWPDMSLSEIHAFGTTFSIVVARTDPGQIAIKILQDKAVVFSATGPNHSVFKIKL